MPGELWINHSFKRDADTVFGRPYDLTTYFADTLHLRNHRQPAWLRPGKVNHHPARRDIAHTHVPTLFFITNINDRTKKNAFTRFITRLHHGFIVKIVDCSIHLHGFTRNWLEKGKQPKGFSRFIRRAKFFPAVRDAPALRSSSSQSGGLQGGLAKSALPLLRSSHIRRLRSAAMPRRS